MLFPRKRKQFETLVLDHVPGLYRLALRLTGNQATAEDMVQETLLRAYRAFDQVEVREGGIKPWLFKILHNLYFNEQLARKRHPVLPNEPSWDQVADPHADAWPEGDLAHLDWDQFDEEIKRGVEALAPEYRIVLLLWALEQLGYRQIAEICNIPVGTVMSRLFRARKELADKLAGYARDRGLGKNSSRGHKINHVNRLPPSVET